MRRQGQSSRREAECDESQFGRRRPEWERRLDAILEADLTRDAAQHAYLLKMQRNVSARQGYQDYHRKDKRQRQSRNRGRKKWQWLAVPLETEPDSILDVTHAKAEAYRVRQTLTPQEFDALWRCAGLDLSQRAVAAQLNLKPRRLRELLASAFSKLNPGSFPM